MEEESIEMGDTAAVQPCEKRKIDVDPTTMDDSGSGLQPPEDRQNGREETAKRSKVDKEKTEQEEDGIKKEEIEEIMTAAPRVAIYELETVESCVHEVVVPTEIEYEPLRQGTRVPAREYSFTLDPFQKESILCVENNQTVLVSAHTSAGKTVVAEYAIAQSLRDKQRVIYTTPIKALSNQKYREFSEEFRDVGLITGDVTINPSASCLIMTTEILRQMLFRGNEIMREVGWVIFDEIHYMRDKERGVVWEETIILLPDIVHCVFLSATIPNARQFAEWISTMHHQPCHVVYTDYRPVPLQHYIYPSGGDGLHLVFDEHGNFREDNFNQAMSGLQNADGGKPAGWNKRGGGRLNQKNRTGAESNVFKVIKTLSERGLAPIIAFSFSKRECEVHAMQLSKLDFNSAEEKELVDQVFTNAVDVLSEEDKKLPQIQHILPMLRKGIGVHHSGLLPLVKETVEILFGEGLLKVLFATETFAMGLNMPARTVIFTNAHKFDGTDFRWITSGEYIQMSGRAGRRGLDDRGICVLIVDEKMSPSVCKELIRGKPGPINSAFHLTYNMVLNLLRVEDVNPEYMLQHSFFQFQHYALVPELMDKMSKLEAELSQISIDDETRIREVISLERQITDTTEEYLTWIQNRKVLIPFANPGRLVRIRKSETPARNDDLGWAMILSYKERVDRRKNPSVSEQVSYSLDVLVRLARGCEAGPANYELKPPPKGEKGIVRVVTLVLKNVTGISSLRMKMPDDVRTSDGLRTIDKMFTEMDKRFVDKEIPLLDAEKDLRINDGAFRRLDSRLKDLNSRLSELGDISEEQRQAFEAKEDLEKRLKGIKDEMKQAQSLLQMDELKRRMRVLRRLGYCTPHDVIELKGRVACEISSGDELLLAEMLFNGLFNNLTPLQINALLSCFVFEEKTEAQPNMTDELSLPLKAMQELAQRIASVSKESGLDIDADQYVERFRPNLMEVVYKWSGGASFAEVCKMTDAFEGSIIRCLRRLEELLRQMCQAARVIGNTDLEAKFHEADRFIKRDIVFAASLYL